MRKKVANAKGYIYCDPWALSIQPKIPNHSIGLVVGLVEGLYSLSPGLNTPALKYANNLCHIYALYKIMIKTNKQKKMHFIFQVSMY